MSREIVAVSMSMLDRFCMRTANLSKKHFQLAAMSTLFMSIKLDEPNPMSLQSLVQLSKGCFQPKHVKMMEGVVLERLDWLTTPVTANVFVRHFLFFLSTDEMTILNVLEVSVFLTELSVCDSFFISHKASTIALACILLALDDTVTVHGTTQSQFTLFVTRLRDVCNLEIDSPSVSACKVKLHLLSDTLTEESPPPPEYHSTPGVSDHIIRDSISPTGVTAMMDAVSTGPPECKRARSNDIS